MIYGSTSLLATGSFSLAFGEKEKMVLGAILSPFISPSDDYAHPHCTQRKAITIFLLRVSSWSVGGFIRETVVAAWDQR